MDRHQVHAKSVSPTKEVIWRRSPGRNVRVFRRGSETYGQRSLISLDEDFASNNLSEGPFSARESYPQKQRQYFTTLQDFHREQAEILGQKRMVGFFVILKTLLLFFFNSYLSIILPREIHLKNSPVSVVREKYE